MGVNEDLSSKLSQEIELLGIKLWVLISISVGVFVTLILSVMSICLLVSRRKKRRGRLEPVFQHVNTTKVLPTYISTDSPWSSSISTTGDDLQLIIVPPAATTGLWDPTSQQHHNDVSWLHSKQGYHNQIYHWFTLRDMLEATHGFSEANILGHGGYGIVYKGQLPDGTLIAVKNLLMNDNNNNMGQVEREFHVELEVIKHARHENLVRFLGYCKEGTHRMLVYEYVDNGNLEQWLHSSPSIVLKWESRMKILHGTAKALAYMHEALEPRVIHRDVKSSNILVDSQWNAKVSDFGLAKLLSAEKHHIETRVMGTFGYVAPEYANTGLLNERCDTYSFGVVVLETVTGRDPVDYARPPGEVNLVDWLNVMVSNHQLEEVVDPNLKEKPTLQELKRIVDIALKCVDQEAERRPKMSQVIQMLESDDNVP